jgi:hypothetical protein
MHSRGLYVQTENESTIDILMVTPEGKEMWISNIDPINDLIATIEIDYSEYRRRIFQLHDLPLFQEKLDIAVSEYEELVNCARKISNLLERIDPVGAFVVRRRIEMILQYPDDGSALYLLESGQRMIDALMEPVLTQLRLRNIFEVTFANTERKTQAERYNILRKTYPQLFRHYFKVKRFPAEDGDMPFGKKVEYSINTLLELRMLELEMYFRQPKRIARCAHCWDYFVPKTKKETLYCDREWGGEKTCKQLGPNAQRRIDQHHDSALAIFEVLRKRMGARYERFMLSNQKTNTEFVLDIDGYFDWSEMAKQARLDYIDGKISAEEFIRRIDKYGELKDFTAQKTEQTGESVLERLVKQDLNFDPARRYFDIQTLDLGESNPQWKVVTAEERMKRDQGSHRPLAEQVKEIHPKKPE